MKIKINKKTIELKYSLRAMLMYENITKQPFTPKTMTDVVTFMYCIVLSSAKDYSLKFEEFLDYMDAHPETLTDFAEWLNSVLEVSGVLKKN